MSTDSKQSPVEEAKSEESSSRWQVGTLIYTKAGLVVLFAWMLWGDFAWSMRERSVMPMAQWYLKQLNVPNLVFALLLSTVPAVVTLVLGPVISYKSDRYRGPRGRRIPFLVWTTPFAAVGMVGMAICPYFGPVIDGWLESWWPGFSWGSLLCFSLFWMLYELAAVIAFAVFGGLVNDVVPSAIVGRFFGLFRAVSLIDGMIFNYFLIGHIDTHFSIILALIGIFYGVAFLTVCLKVKEGDYPPPPVESGGRPGLLGDLSGGTRAYLRDCFSHRYYVFLFLMLMVAAACFTPVNIFMIPYARSVGMDMETYGKCMTATFAMSLGLSYFIGWLADRFHPLRVVIVVLVGYALVALWGAFFVRDARSFAIGLVLHSLLSGCYYTGSASIGQRLFPRSKFAQFASAVGVLLALANLIVAPLIGLMIDHYQNFYPLTFAAGCAIASVAAICGAVVYREFCRFGGPKQYVAPL